MPDGVPIPKGKLLLSGYILDNTLDDIYKATIAETQVMYISAKEYDCFYIACYEVGVR